MDTLVDAKLVEKFFFEAMGNGWAIPSPKISMPNFPGAKCIPFRIGEYSLLDYYFVAPGSKSSYGTTVIWVSERPVWIMHYGGWYDKNVIPFLKRALMRNYEAGIFLGGRGPENLEGADHTLQYLNKVEQNDFASFRGSEKIISTSPQTGVPPGQILGEHHYFGGLML